MRTQSGLQTKTKARYMPRVLGFFLSIITLGIHSASRPHLQVLLDAPYVTMTKIEPLRRTTPFLIKNVICSCCDLTYSVASDGSGALEAFHTSITPQDPRPYVIVPLTPGNANNIVQKFRNLVDFIPDNPQQNVCMNKLISYYRTRFVFDFPQRIASFKERLFCQTNKMQNFRVPAELPSSSWVAAHPPWFGIMVPLASWTSGSVNITEIFLLRNLHQRTNQNDDIGISVSYIDKSLPFSASKCMAWTAMACLSISYLAHRLMATR